MERCYSFRCHEVIDPFSRTNCEYTNLPALNPHSGGNNFFRKSEIHKRQVSVFCPFFNFLGFYSVSLYYRSGARGLILSVCLCTAQTGVGTRLILELQDVYWRLSGLDS